MRHDYGDMKVAYGIRRADGSLVVVGHVRYQESNGVTLTLSDQAAGVGTALHNFVLLAPASLASWNAAQIPDLSEARVESKLWANPRDERPDHRPQTFKGYPIRANMTLLVPMVDLSKFEPEHSGFIESLPSEDKTWVAPKKKPKRQARSLDDL